MHEEAETKAVRKDETNTGKWAVFLDRDGVICEDVHLLVGVDQLRFPPETLDAFKIMRNFACRFVVVTNQTVVARGLISESDLDKIHVYIKDYIYNETGVLIDAFYYCPHHPQATLESYRVNCECRKPKPGLLCRAAAELNICLGASYMIGDRMSDIIAGARAGCTTIQLLSGRHADAPIVSEAMDQWVQPDFSCDTLLEACFWMQERQ